MKSGDILGGIASTTNTVTGVVQGLSGNITKADGSKATLDNIKDGDFKSNNNFYADAGVNFGYTKSSSKTNSHNESAVVTTIKGKDENSSITYNNVKNIEYVGTQAQDTKFIYNNVENINKRAVELKNSYSSSSTSSGISTGVTVNYNNGFQAEGKEIVAFYDKVTKKIFINQNAKDEEVRASIAREYKIKEDLELGRGKVNDKGQLRSTVAGEIAYDEIKGRLKKGDKNPISASSFDVAKMDKDSEVTADGYRAERKAKKDIETAKARYRKKLESISAKYSNRTSLSPEEIAEIKELERQARLERDREIAEIEKGIESIRKYEEYAKTELASQYQLINSTSYIPEKRAAEARYNFLRRNIDTTKEYKEGTKKVYRDAFKEEFKDNFKEGVEGTVEYEIVKKVVETGSKTLATVGLFFLWSTPAGGGELLPNEIKTKRDPRKIITPATYGYLEKRFPEYIEAKGNEYTLKGNYKDGMLPPKNQGEKIDKVIFEDIKNFYYGTKTLDDKISESDGKFYGSLIGSTSGVIATSYGINKAKSIVNSLNGVDKLGTIEASSNKFIEPQKYSLSNVEARKWYLEQEAKIPGMIDSSLSLEEQAKQAFNLRNKFRTEARELMADRATAKSLYKTDPNWSWEKIVQKQVEKGLSGDDIYKEIIASSQRSRDAVNKSLGVK